MVSTALLAEKIMQEACYGQYQDAQDAVYQLLHYLACNATSDVAFIKSVLTHFTIMTELHRAHPGISHVHILHHTKQRASELLALAMRTAPKDVQVSVLQLP